MDILPACTNMYTKCMAGGMDLLELELQAVVSCLVWMLGTTSSRLL